MKLVPIIFLALVIWVTYKVGVYNGAQSSSPTCATDWHRCSDIQEFANEYQKVPNIQVACETAAEEKSLYGSPEFPWLGGFTTFAGQLTHTVNVNGKNDVVIVAEDLSIYVPNKYGGKDKMSVWCKYDLTTNNVLNIAFAQPLE